MKKENDLVKKTDSNIIDKKKRANLRKAVLGGAAIGAGIIGISGMANADVIFKSGGNTKSLTNIISEGIVSAGSGSGSTIRTGNANTAVGTYGLAFGASNTASGNCSTAVGYNNTASAVESSALGTNINNSTTCASMIGTTNTASLTLTCKGVNSACYTFANLGTGDVQSVSGVLSVNSDERLKNLCGDYCEGYCTIAKITPIRYDWKDNTMNTPRKNFVGFSAQNVQTAIPEAVAENKDGYLGLSDRPIVAALVNSAKEHEKEIKELKERIEQLEEK